MTRYRSQWFILVALLLAIGGIASQAEAQIQKPSSTSAQPYFARKRVVIVTAVAPPPAKEKPLSADLAHAAEQELRSHFSPPDYLAVPKTEITAKDTAPRSANEIPNTLSAIRKRVQADQAFYVQVKEASSRQVTLLVWAYDPRTQTIPAEGKQLRRSWSDYPVQKQNNDGGWTSSLTLPPMDTTRQSVLIHRMLEEWLVDWRREQSPEAPH